MKLRSLSFVGIGLFLCGASLTAASSPPGARIALGIGKPTSLAMQASWVSLTTTVESPKLAFSSSDQLQAVMTVTVPGKNKDVIWRVRIVDDSGAEVFSDELVQAKPSANSYFWAPDIGTLAAGYYRVDVKIKQGKKKVGMKFWIRII